MSRDDDARTQLGLIEEIASVLGGARIRFWLRGGWAFDFLTSEITRPHRDVDIVTWRRHARRIRRLLETRRYHVERVDGAAAIHFSKQGQSVGVVFFRRGSNGRLVTPGYQHWPWPSAPLAPRLRSLRGVACRTMTAEALLEEKEAYHRHAGRSPRPQDIESIEALRSLVAARSKLRHR